MSVQTSTNRVQHDTNGTTGPWTVNFYFLADADLAVYYTNAAGTETLLTLTTDYSVTGAGDENGGTVTTVSAYVAGGSITIIRDLDATQPTDWTDGDSFPAATLERALDRLTMLAQQTDEVASRALVVAPSDNVSVTLPPAATRASRYLAFDSSGAVTSAAPPTGTAAGLETDLADTVDAAKGSAKVGFNVSLNYTAGSIGKYLYDIFKVGGVLPATSGVNLTSLNASNLGSGTVPAARIGSATAYSTGPLTVNGKAYTPTSSQAFTATPTFDASLSNVFEFSGAMTANVTSCTITNPVAGQTIQIRVKQDATGSRTFASPSGAKITGSVGSTASTASILTLTYSAMDSRWEGSWLNLPA